MLSSALATMKKDYLLKGFQIWAAVACFLFSSASIATDLIPVENFSRLPMYSKPRLSPDGTKIAYVENLKDEGLSLLASVELATGERTYLTKTDNEEIKLNWFRWANNDTLIMSVVYGSKRGTTKTTETRLLAKDVKQGAEAARLLIKPRRGIYEGQHVSQFQDNVIDFLPDDPEHILVALDLDVQLQPSVYKLNIYTKKKKRLIKGKMRIRDWITDQQGEVRVGKMLDYKSGLAKIYVRDNAEQDWKALFEYNALEDPAMSALGFGLDRDVLFYKAYHEGMKSLFKINLKTMEKTLVYHDPNYDVDGGLIYSDKTRDVIGLYHAHTPSGRVYWDKDRSAFQKALDKALPETDNYLVDFSQDENVYILYSENDHIPGAYYLGYRKEQEILMLFEQYPEINPQALSEHKLVTYKARDGMEIEGYLSVPKGQEGPVSAVIFPHGGPGARDYAGFDYWTSYLNSRGYAVFRPNFRGSTGYGYEFAQSQMAEWGLSMQDDLTDATHWLIEQGVAKKDKVCIVGASYGGYAATMGVVKEPELYACAVSFAGVTDLEKLRIRGRRYVNSKFLNRQLGDEDLDERSPAELAKRVKVPVLLVHGADDRVVDVRQSRVMAEELEDYDKDFEYIELENGDHYLSIQRNRHTFFKAMDGFLRTHLH